MRSQVAAAAAAAAAGPRPSPSLPPHHCKVREHEAAQAAPPKTHRDHIKSKKTTYIWVRYLRGQRFQADDEAADVAASQLPPHVDPGGHATSSSVALLWPTHSFQTLLPLIQYGLLRQNDGGVGRSKA